MLKKSIFLIFAITLIFLTNTKQVFGHSSKCICTGGGTECDFGNANEPYGCNQNIGQVQIVGSSGYECNNKCNGNGDYCRGAWRGTLPGGFIGNSCNHSKLDVRGGTLYYGCTDCAGTCAKHGEPGSDQAWPYYGYVCRSVKNSFDSHRSCFPTASWGNVTDFWSGYEGAGDKKESTALKDYQTCTGAGQVASGSFFAFTCQSMSGTNSYSTGFICHNTATYGDECCSPANCSSCGNNTGVINDGCGGTFDCGSCCTPATCASLNYPTTAPSCPGSTAETTVVSNGCGTDLTCYTGQCNCQTCESITSYGGQWLTAKPNCTETGGYTSRAFSNLCNGGTVCYKKTVKTCANYPDYPLTAAQATTTQCPHGRISAVKSNGCTPNSLTCYKCCKPSKTCNNYLESPYTLAQANTNCYAINGPYTKNNGCSSSLSVNNLSCYSCKTCANQGYVSSCSNTQLFVPNGVFGGTKSTPEICGNCFAVSAPRFQGTSGNMFAQDNIKLSLDQTLNLPNNFLIRKSGNWNINTSNNSGLAMTNTGGLNFTNATTTQRSSSNTSAVGTQGYPANRKEDYEYFKNLIDYSRIPNCNDNALNNFEVINDSQVCKITNPDLLNQALTIAENTKKVVFVEGDLNLTQIISVPATSYLAVIASGTITFQPNLGDDISGLTNTVADITGNKGLNQAAAINGVFIADKLNFPHLTTNNPNDQNCDKKLTLGGTFVGWQGITMSRNFEECYSIGNTYPDYNKNYNTLTFKYRPEFVLNTPSWMKQVTELTLESN